MWTKILIGLVFAYAAVCAAIYFFQTSLLFPAGAVQKAGPLPAGAQRLVVETPGGERIHGVHIRHASGGGGGDLALLLGFGGNAWNADDVALYLAELFPDHDIVAFHYRGYAPSGGRPGAAALLEDGPLIHDAVVRRLRPARVVAIGFSVGSGVAARLARERPLAGLILVTPFDSLASVAARHYRWLPVTLLFRHEMPAASDLAHSRVPVALLAAERDDLILPERTEALRRRIPNRVFDRTISRAGHNDIYQREEFRAAMREALAALTAAPRTTAKCCDTVAP